MPANPADPSSDTTNRLQLLEWHPVRQDTLRGFATERGKRRYSPVIEIPDRDMRERLSSTVIALIRQRDPGSLS